VRPSASTPLSTFNFAQLHIIPQPRIQTPLTINELEASALARAGGMRKASKNALFANLIQF
jgi:hypothetical protein